MKLAHLKTELKKSVLFLVCLGVVGLTGTATCAPENTTATYTTAKQVLSDIEQVLTTCIFEHESNKNPFSFFIDKLTRIAQSGGALLEQEFTNPGLAKQFINDINGIRLAKPVMKDIVRIKNVLTKYAAFLSPSLKAKMTTRGLGLIGDLKKRLSYTQTVPGTQQQMVLEAPTPSSASSSQQIPSTTSAPQIQNNPAIEQDTETYYQAFIGYLQLMYEGGKAYFQS